MATAPDIGHLRTFGKTTAYEDQIDPMDGNRGRPACQQPGRFAYRPSYGQGTEWAAAVDPGADLKRPDFRRS